MRGKLLSLLLAWCEKESIRMVGRGLAIPDSKYVWIKDKLGRYHFGSYEPGNSYGSKYTYSTKSKKWKWSFGEFKDGNFIQGQAAFTLIPGTKRPDFTRLDEFGCAIRKLDETSQGLIILSYLGSEEEWRSYLGEKRLRDGQADKWLKKAVLILMRECRRRGLV